MKMKQEFPKSLYQSENREVVALSEDFRAGRMTHLHADITSGNIELIRYNPDFNLNFKLSGDELDTLLFAWTAFQEKQQEARLKEEHRLEETKQQALALAAECPAIQVKHLGDDPPFWVVTLPSVENFVPKEYADGEDDLLRQVQDAKAAYDEQQRIQAEVEKAFELVASIPGMKITGDGEPYFFISFRGGMEREWLHPQDLLNAVQEVIKRVQRVTVSAH